MPSHDLTQAPSKPPLAALVLPGAAILMIQALALFLMGRSPVCTCGYVALWYGDLKGSGLSQHLTDWYTFTHVTHGLAFYGLLHWLTPRASLGLRLALMLGLEASWEVVENSPVIIDRYRQSALAQGYDGDSIVNSLADSVSAGLGFLLARGLPARASLGLAVASELFLALAIRDNLTLNLIQLAHPTQAISDWQAR